MANGDRVYIVTTYTLLFLSSFYDTLTIFLWGGSRRYYHPRGRSTFQDAGSPVGVHRLAARRT